MPWKLIVLTSRRSRWQNGMVNSLEIPAERDDILGSQRLSSQVVRSMANIDSGNPGTVRGVVSRTTVMLNISLEDRCFLLGTLNLWV